MIQLDIYIHFLNILFHYGLSQDIEYSSLCYTVGPCCLSILYIIAYICWPQPLSPSLPQPPPPWQPPYVLYTQVSFLILASPARAPTETSADVRLPEPPGTAGSWQLEQSESSHHQSDQLALDLSWVISTPTPELPQTRAPPEKQRPKSRCRLYPMTNEGPTVSGALRKKSYLIFPARNNLHCITLTSQVVKIELELWILEELKDFLCYKENNK